MKLTTTICQFNKLFLLLTAIFLLNTFKSIGHCQELPLLHTKQQRNAEADKAENSIKPTASTQSYQRHNSTTTNTQFATTVPTSNTQSALLAKEEKTLGGTPTSLALLLSLSAVHATKPLSQASKQQLVSNKKLAAAGATAGDVNATVVAFEKQANDLANKSDTNSNNRAAKLTAKGIATTNLTGQTKTTTTTTAANHSSDKSSNNKKLSRSTLTDIESGFVNKISIKDTNPGIATTTPTQPTNEIAKNESEQLLLLQTTTISTNHSQQQAKSVIEKLTAKSKAGKKPNVSEQQQTAAKLQKPTAELSQKTPAKPPAAAAAAVEIDKSQLHKKQQQKRKSSPAKRLQQTEQQKFMQQQKLTQKLSQQQQQQSQQRVGVLMPSQLLDKMHVQQGFENFVKFFQVNLHNVSVDFIRDNDLSSFIKLLESSRYTKIVKTLNTGINVDDDLVEGVSFSQATTSAASAKVTTASSESSAHVANVSKITWRQNDGDSKLKNPFTNAGVSNSIGYCHLAEQFTREFNKSVLLWPCPHMKESSNFLPSFEAISFAVKSIATKLNWTQVDIFAGDENWGLPLAIAANLQLPYKIEIGDNIRELHAQDKIGKAIIITAGMNDNSTLRLLSKLEQLQHTKILLIDIVATSFNAENLFYKYVAKINASSELMANLLLLTVLSDKYRHFLNVAFDDNGIEMVQNFRQLKRWRILTDAINMTGNLENATRRPAAGFYQWPIHLDKSLLKLLQQFDEAAGLTTTTTTTTVTTTTTSTAQQLATNECAQLTAMTGYNLLEICKNLDKISEACTRHFASKYATQSMVDSLAAMELRALLEQLCQLQQPTAASNPQQLAQLMQLRNVIDLFNFYDFLIANIVPSPEESDYQNVTHTPDEPKYDFIVLDIVRASSGNGLLLDNDTLKWRPLLILEQHEIHLNTYITHSIQPGYDEWLLVSSVHMWQCGAICWTIVAICIGVLIVIVAASVAAGIALRNYLLRKRLSKGPNKIVLSASDFVFPVDSRRVDEGIEAMLCCWLQQLQEFGGPEVDKPDLLKGSIGSLKNLGFVIPGAAPGTTTTAANGKSGSGTGSLARHNPALLDMRARYNGDLVQLKEIPLNGNTELKSKAMDLLVMAHGLRHENINPLIGWLSDPNRTAMVFDYCSRGSLQDVLIMDEIKLDWSFRLSLLTDLVRGMRYLHASPLRVHGTLTSRNCVVDARWVLKITDYGLTTFFEAQGLSPVARCAKELLWTAPEILRAMKSHHHHHGRGVFGTQMGDVYSFGIIMQEVVVRGEPYCMLSLSAEEIIAKIKKPPPLIRPSVSKGAAPPEAINIMRQCWAEQPEMRPDFNSVYERFKMLNHGRKVNFVDTMFQMLEKYSNNLEELIRERTEQLDIERKKTEQLLNRMLPSSVAEKLKMGLAVDPEEFSDVTIYFSDIVGFTTIAAHCSPVQVVDLLNDLYTIFDATINAYNVYKVETIGDAYMVVSGLPVKIPDHAEQIATMALDLLHQSGRFNVKHLPGVPLQLRIGLHTGPCCAGVVGLTMPRYCLFGDTVNTASRMESTGSSWRIHMSQETRDRLESCGGYHIEPRGLIDIKGKGMMNTFWLLGKKGFDKQLPTPPPVGLDETLIRNAITLKGQANKSRTSTNPSSSQSSSLAGESVEVKVEITPPTNIELSSSQLPNSYSLDSNSTNTISPNMTLCPDFPTKTPNASPQSRKMSELSPENLLNPSNFNRLPSSAGGSSSRLYKKIEEMMDLSLPYNHYKCLSPSESNLSQFYEGKYLYSAGIGLGLNSQAISSGGAGVAVSTAGGSVSSGGGSVHSSTSKFDSKPGSSRLLRRQFSLDRDDTHSKSEHGHHHQHSHGHQHHHHHHTHQQHHQTSLQANYQVPLTTLTAKTGMLDIPMLHDVSRSPKGTLVKHKQNSTSITQDLEKIEEIPLSPASSQHHSSLDSNLNRSPPSTIEAQSPPPPTGNGNTVSVGLMATASPPQSLLSAPTSPAPSRSLNGIALAASNIVDSPTTTDVSTTTTTASVNSNNTTPGDENHVQRQTELSLNVEALLSR